MPIRAATIMAPLYMYSGSAAAPGKVFLAGVIPDGVKQLVIVVNDGEKRVIAVHDNAYGVVLNQTPRAIEFRTASGTTAITRVGN
jgi:hypothetical protein